MATMAARKPLVNDGLTIVVESRNAKIQVEYGTVKTEPYEHYS